MIWWIIGGGTWLAGCALAIAFFRGVAILNGEGEPRE